MNENENRNTEAPSRRDLLAVTAAAAGAGIVASSCASTSSHSVAQAGVPAMARAPLADGETIKIGVIGTGGMGTGHCGSICNLAKNGREKVLVVALSDVCKPRLERAHAKVTEIQGSGQAVDTYRDYKQLLAREDLHGVLIASPEHWHSQMAIDAMTAGKDVYLEKPMTLRLPEAMALREVALASNQLLQVGTQKLQLPKYQTAKKMLAQGAIGKPVFSQTSYCRNSRDGEWLYGIEEGVVPGPMLDWEAWCGPLGVAEWDTEVYHRWRRYKRYSTGIIGDLLVHLMTPMIDALQPGWPVHVTASGGHFIDKAMENHDMVNLTIGFESEHTMIVAGSTCNALGLETLIRGHEANMYLGGGDVLVKPEQVFAEDIDEQLVKHEGLHDQDEHRLDWLDSIRTREQPRGDVTTATKVMVIVDLATRAMWEGSAFAFDPASMRAVRA